jgi:hypothetical protein
MTSRHVLLVVLLALTGCEGHGRGKPPGTRAELGVFYGGQVQELREIPLELDPARQRHGFRIVLEKPYVREVPVRWEIDKPATRAQKRHARVTELGEGMLPAGQVMFERAFTFRPGDPLGVYNFRVLVGNELVLDRSISVIDPR